jgi:hypothetical protein
MHEIKEINQSQLYGDVFSQLTHFVGEYVDIKRDERCLFVEKRNGVSHIRHPNQFAFRLKILSTRA